MTSDTFVIVHAVTDNSPIGEPTPPPDDGGTWHAVHLGREQTTWRRIEIGLAAATPAPGMQIVKSATPVAHLNFHQAVKALAKPIDHGGRQQRRRRHLPP
jgi:hypothetical protein